MVNFEQLGPEVSGSGLCDLTGKPEDRFLAAWLNFLLIFTVCGGAWWACGKVKRLEQEVQGPRL